MDVFIARARRLRAGQTRAEDKLWRALRGRALGERKFRRQHPIGGFTVDLVCLDARLIVEVDGATHSTDAELRLDGERTRVLEACGYQVMRVTNDEIATNLSGVLETILMELDRRVTL